MTKNKYTTGCTACSATAGRSARQNGGITTRCSDARAPGARSRPPGRRGRGPRPPAARASYPLPLRADRRAGHLDPALVTSGSTCRTTSHARPGRSCCPTRAPPRRRPSRGPRTPGRGSSPAATSHRPAVYRPDVAEERRDGSTSGRQRSCAGRGSSGAPGGATPTVPLADGGPVPPGAPLLVQVSRWDRLKDPLGVVQGFVGEPRLDRAHLLLAGPLRWRRR